jgi:hypothetical protein
METDVSVVTTAGGAIAPRYMTEHPLSEVLQDILDAIADNVCHRKVSHR